MIPFDGAVGCCAEEYGSANVRVAANAMPYSRWSTIHPRFTGERPSRSGMRMHPDSKYPPLYYVAVSVRGQTTIQKRWCAATGNALSEECRRRRTRDSARSMKYRRWSLERPPDDSSDDRARKPLGLEEDQLHVRQRTSCLLRPLGSWRFSFRSRTNRIRPRRTAGRSTSCSPLGTRARRHSAQDQRASPRQLQLQLAGGTSRNTLVGERAIGSSLPKRRSPPLRIFSNRKSAPPAPVPTPAAPTPTVPAATVPAATVPAGHVWVRHPITVEADGVPRVPEPWPVEVRPRSPRRHVPSPSVRGRVKIGIRHAVRFRGRRSRRNPHPTLAGQVNPLTRRIRLDPRGLIRWR